jgi:S1-C subfamily serine protease
VKKTAYSFALAISAVASSGCVKSCEPSYNHDSLSQEILEDRVQSAVKDIERSVRCVRVTAKYRQIVSTKDLMGSIFPQSPLALDMDADPEQKKQLQFGSALAFSRDDEYTYLMTAYHVVNPDNILFEPTEGIYRRASFQISLVDNKFDKNTEDDISVEVVEGYPDEDVAILRTKEYQYVSTVYSTLDTDKLRIGEEVYIFGYPKATTSFVSTGKIGNITGVPHYDEEKIKCPVMVDAPAIGGNSGGPLFVRRGDRLYFVGVVRGMMEFMTLAVGKSCYDEKIPKFGY